MTINDIENLKYFTYRQTFHKPKRQNLTIQPLLCEDVHQERGTKEHTTWQLSNTYDWIVGTNQCHDMCALWRQRHLTCASCAFTCTLHVLGPLRHNSMLLLPIFRPNALLVIYSWRCVVLELLLMLRWPPLAYSHRAASYRVLHHLIFMFLPHTLRCGMLYMYSCLVLFSQATMTSPTDCALGEGRST